MHWLTSHTEALGFWAGILTTVAFVPQLVRTWRVGGEQLSWLMLTLFGTGVGLWFIYGYLRSSGPLMLANGLTGLQVLFILGLKIWRAIRVAAQVHHRSPRPIRSNPGRPELGGSNP